MISAVISTRSCWRVLHPVWKRIGRHIFATPQRALTGACLSTSPAARPSQHGAQPITFLLPSHEATQDLAATFCASRQQGDAYLIHGSLGSGKSAFCRAFIRFACDDDEMPVPSPTYVLLNTYDEEIVDGPAIHHLDLYRLPKSSSQSRLDIPSLLMSGTALLEWPERLSELPGTYIDMRIYPLRTDAAQTACSMARNWSAELPPPRVDTSQDIRWRLVSMQGVGVPVAQRYSDGRHIIDEFGMVPGMKHGQSPLWPCRLCCNDSEVKVCPQHAEYIEVPEADAIHMLDLVGQ